MKKLKITAIFIGILFIVTCLLFGREIMAYVQEEIALAKWEPTPSEGSDKPLSHWELDEKGWQYIENTGSPVKDTWFSIDGNSYFFDEDGYMKTGWIEQSDTWYYLDYAGERETGWLEDQGKHYYLDDDGAMVTGWYTIEGTKYHFDDSGSLSTGWILTDDQYYYIDEDGTRHTGWLIDKDKYYFLNEDGIMQTGWLKDSDVWYYMGSDGAMVNGWQTINDKTYFFEEAGSMKTGWLDIGDAWYYFSTDGDMQTGWLELADGTYYLNGDGKMHTGGLVDNQKVRYFGSDGRYNPDAGKVAAGTKIALTFDDGPGPYTDRLLDCLSANDASATFFLLGNQVDSYGDTIKRMFDMKCQVGNHSYDHSTLTSLEKKDAREQITSTAKKIREITGKDPSWVVRPPGGNYDEETAKTISQPLILWSVDTLDWKTKDVQTTVETVLNSIQAGDIVLMHDIHRTSVEAAEVLIPTLKSLGYDLVTVNELAAANGVNLKGGKAYASFK